ncbi:MAG: mcp [Rhodospirillaceae bacterium]|nr:MAG: mcp [Rhodospirillaceae bacterium]
MIAPTVEEQEAASQEIARNVEQAAAEEAGHSANRVLSAAGELSRQAETLRGEVNDFTVFILWALIVTSLRRRRAASAALGLHAIRRAAAIP